jgi:hypothetical protein
MKVIVTALSHDARGAKPSALFKPDHDMIGGDQMRSSSIFPVLAHRIAGTLMIVGTLAAAQGASTPAEAEIAARQLAANHDGIYAVRIVTEQGACDKSYFWTIAISGGRVRSAGDTPLEASGEINRYGIVKFAFRGFNEVAHVSGRVKGRKGSGTWHSPTLACAGTWLAIRQS